MDTVGPFQVVVDIEYRTGRRFRLFCQPEHRQGRAKPVLVTDHVAVGVAEGLFVAEDEPRPRHAVGRPGDPLEPGQRLGVPDAGRRGDLGQQRRGDDGGGHQPRLRRRLPGAPVQQAGPQQRAHLVPGQHPPPVPGARRVTRAIGYGHREPVPVRIAGHHQVGAEPPRVGQRQVQGTRLLRVGEGDRREVRVGFGLRGHHMRRREARQPQGPQHEPARHPVHRRVDQVQVDSRPVCRSG